MGTPVPIEQPEIDVTKHYCITVDWFDDWYGATDCTQEYGGTTHCCVTGSNLKYYIENGYECTKYLEICMATGYSAQRITCIEGPFDSHADCVNFCSGL